MATKPAPVESPEELEEALGDESTRKRIFASAETAQDYMRNYAKAAMRAGGLEQQIKDASAAAIRDFLIENGDVKRPDFTDGGSTKPVFGAVNRGAAHNKRAIGAALDREFTDWGDFLANAWHKSATGPEKWRQIRNDYGTIAPEAGGFLVPETLRSTLLGVALESSIVRRRARIVPMDTLRVGLPAIDETSHASSVFGGITAAWTGEGDTIGESEASFGRVVLEAKKLAALADVPNELLQDSGITFQSFIEDVLPQAIAWYEDEAFLTGGGAGEPLGVLNSQALVTVAEESGQPNDTIVWENVVKMFSRMLPSSLGRAVWVANIDTFPQLATMALAVGTGGSSIWVQNGSEGAPLNLLGRPIIFTEHVPTLGGAGEGKDFSFIDFGHYLLGDRLQMRVESSPHEKFSRDITTFRIIERCDGRPGLLSAITPKNSTATLSPFVTLGERDT